MDSLATKLLPGLYHYHYSTFVDTPQQLCLHFITPDGRQAYVSYPGRCCPKVAQLIPISWFDSVILEPAEGQPRLMDFLNTNFVNWLTRPSLKAISRKPLMGELSQHATHTALAA